MIKLHNGTFPEVSKDWDSNKFETIISDPPYGLKLTLCKWDYDVPSIEAFKECYRLLKPGGTMLCFAGARTQHRMAVNIEDAGFILKDTIMWFYGSGFPKTQKIKTEGFEGYKTTNLKPAYEPIILAMKPNEGSYADNALKHGVAGLNIGECRIEMIEEDFIKNTEKASKKYIGVKPFAINPGKGTVLPPNHKGRFPANVILDEEAGRMLDEQSGVSNGGTGETKIYDNTYKNNWLGASEKVYRTSYADKGGASRFFYCPKASKAERNAGCEGMEEKIQNSETNIRTYNDRCKTCKKKFISPKDKICQCEEKITDKSIYKNKNNHPTIKPIKLMQYLCNLTKTPTGGTVFDPYMGSGSTGIAAVLTDRNFCGIEQDENFYNIAKNRIEHHKNSDIFLGE